VDRQVGSSLLRVPLELRLDHLPRLRQRLVEWSDGAVAAPSVARDWPERLRPSTRYYLLGLVDSRLGNTPSALAWADSLVALPIAVAADSQLIAGLAHVVRADVAVRQGDPEAALRELDRVSADVPPAQLPPWVSAPWYAGLVRVRACLEADQPDQALQWLRHYVAAWGGPDANLYGVYHRDMAYALDALGRAEEAAAHYGRFVDAWESADPELQPQVSAARERLAALTEEGR
jgi:tetratricopeptide (TPR) repeat protein